MAVAGVDQVAALASALFGAVSLTFPASRPVDALTRSHARAAARLHGAACWLLRGPDLASVVRRTPYTTESAQELWAYYEGLPLTARPDVFIGFWCALELLRASGTFSRKEHPLLGRVIDAYTAALGAACFVPRRFFFHLHRLLWSSEYRAAVREAGEPAPLLLSREALAYLERLVGSASRGAAPPGGEDRQDSDVLELEILQGVSGERLCTVSAQGGWGVGDLKVAVEEKAGIAPGQQRLLVGNEPLSTKMPDLRATLRGKPPVVTLLVGPDPWPALEGALHDTIRGRVQELPESFSFPSLREMSLGVSSFFVAVPGMYGGFNVEREGGENDTDDHPVLQAESWSRVCAGSGQRHIIDAAGARLVAEGFV